MEIPIHTHITNILRASLNYYLLTCLLAYYLRNTFVPSKVPSRVLFINAEMRAGTTTCFSGRRAKIMADLFQVCPRCDAEVPLNEDRSLCSQRNILIIWIFARKARSLARSIIIIVGGAAEKYARARSGDTAFFISLQTEHKKQGEETWTKTSVSLGTWWRNDQHVRGRWRDRTQRYR